MIQKQLVQNSDGQNLFVLVEGPEDATRNIVFVHGNGVDMHGDFFDDVVPALHAEGFRTIRFDLRGCGKSEGTQEEGNYAVFADDVRCVLAWAREQFAGEWNIIAQSMGCQVVAKVCPEGIVRTVFTSIPSSDNEVRIQETKKRILAQGGVWDENGITWYVKKDGSQSRRGPTFWKEVRAFNAIEATERFSHKTKLLIVRPEQDDIVPDIGVKEYAAIPTLEFIRLPGNHSFKNPSDRAELIKKVVAFLN